MCILTRIYNSFFYVVSHIIEDLSFYDKFDGGSNIKNLQLWSRDSEKCSRSIAVEFMVRCNNDIIFCYYVFDCDKHYYYDNDPADGRNTLPMQLQVKGNCDFFERTHS